MLNFVSFLNFFVLTNFIFPKELMNIEHATAVLSNMKPAGRMEPAAEF